MSLSLATGLLDSPALIRWQRQAQDGITRRLLCDQGYSRTSAKQKRTLERLGDTLSTDAKFLRDGKLKNAC